MNRYKRFVTFCIETGREWVFTPLNGCGCLIPTYTIENIYDQIGSPLWLSSKFDSSIKIEPATDSSMTFSQAVDEKYQQLEQLKEIEGKDNKELWVQAIKTNIGMNGN